MTPKEKAKENYEIQSSVRELHQYKLGLEDGYNKAKETLYTEEEVLQLLLRLQQTESYDNLYEWFKQFKK